MNKLLLLLVLCSIAFACKAETAERDAYRAAPSWVRIDLAALAEDADAARQADRPSLYVARNVREAPGYEVGSFRLRHIGRVVSSDLYRAEGRALFPAVQRDPEFLQGSFLRPSIDVARGWRVSVPNLRLHSIKVLVRNDFY
jgi:hypothetical protein